MTRPQPLGQSLCDQIDAAGDTALYFPTLTINPPKDEVFFHEQMGQLAQFEWIIFVSPQAVLQSYRLIPSNHGKIAAIGESTANLLRSLHFAVEACPTDNWDTEGLLSLAAFHQVQDAKIAIIKGMGGRKLLFDSLIQKGALVTEIIAYQRDLPQVDVSQYLVLLHNRGIDMILCTSIDGLVNLKTLLDAEWSNLKTTRLLVISNRIKSKAEELGFKNIFLAKNASNEAVLAALQQVRTQTMKTQIENNPPIKNKRRFFSWKRISILLSLISLLILFGCFFLASQYYSRIVNQQILSQETNKALEVRINNLVAQGDQLTHRVNEQSMVINALQQTQTGLNRNEWLIIEAEFLVKLANDQLQLEHNPHQAIELLQAADHQIRIVEDASMLPLRKALAEDIASLQSVAQVDVSGIYLQLAALNQQVNQLPLQTQSKENVVGAAISDDQSLAWWKKGLRETWQGLKQIVIVRYNKSGQQPLILPEARDFLYMNLHAAMEKAMWGLLHQQPVVYDASLVQLLEWIKKYFVQDASVTQSLIKNVEALQKINVKPTLPTVSASLQAFQEYFALHKQ